MQPPSRPSPHGPLEGEARQRPGGGPSLPLWRASQTGLPPLPCLDSGHPSLNRVLPGGGWPRGALTELLAQAPGVGELRLLQPALGALEPGHSIVLLQPPAPPNAVAWAQWQGPAADRPLLWLQPDQPRDALWAAERVLKHGSCGALLFWAARIPSIALRRLHAAAQVHGALCFLFRPADAAREPSPAPLRLALHASGPGIRVDVLKRRGPPLSSPLSLDLACPAFPGAPASPRHARPVPVDRPLPVAVPHPAIAGMR